MSYTKSDMETIYRRGILAGFINYANYAGSGEDVIDAAEKFAADTVKRALSTIRNEKKENARSIDKAYLAWVKAGCPKEGISLGGSWRIKPLNFCGDDE